MNFEVLGQRLRKLRGDRTQLRVAQVVGIDNSVYSRMEAGDKKKIDPEVLSKLADYYGVSTDYLMGRSEVMQPKGELSELEQKLLEAFNRLSDEDKEYVSGLIQRIKRDQP